MDTIITVLVATAIFLPMFTSPRTKAPKNSDEKHQEVNFTFFSGSSPKNKTCPHPDEEPVYGLPFVINDIHLKLDGVVSDRELRFEWFQTKGFAIPKKWRCLPGQASTVMYGSQERNMTFVPVGIGLYCFTLVVSYVDPENDWPIISGNKEFCLTVHSGKS